MPAARRKHFLHWTLLILAVVAWLAFEGASRSRLTPPPHVTTLTEFLHWRPQTTRVLVVSSAGQEYLCALGPKAGLLSSGPSAYVFDASGLLKDWTTDAGDDPHFRDKWAFNKPLRELTPADAARRAAAADVSPGTRPAEGEVDGKVKNSGSHPPQRPLTAARP